MPFDPSKPIDHSPIVAAELRGQFTGLKALIPDGSTLTPLSMGTTDPPTQTQIQLIEAKLNEVIDVLRGSPQPGPFTATGFGDPNANGVYTYAGLHGGRPMYVNPAGYVLFVPVTAPPDYWIQAPPLNEGISELYFSTTPEPTGPWQVTLDGTPPAGTVS